MMGQEVLRTEGGAMREEMLRLPVPKKDAFRLKRQDLTDLKGQPAMLYLIACICRTV